jgi:hypothetical protein
VRGGQRDTEEVFPNYGLVLHTEQWPSIADGRKDVELLDVNEMPPQRAAACLSKLVRWARYEPAGEISVIDDIDLREEEVRSSVLGRNLAARALGLTEPQMHALMGEVGQGASVDINVTAAEMVVAMGERFPDWGLPERIEMGMYLASKLDERFVIKERKDDG